MSHAGYHRSRDGNSNMHTHQRNAVNRRSRSHTCHHSKQVRAWGWLCQGSAHEFTAKPSNSQRAAAGHGNSQQIHRKSPEVCFVVTCVALLRLVVNGCELFVTSCESYAMYFTLVVACGLLRFAAIQWGIINTNNCNNEHICIRKCMHTSCNNK